MWRLVRKGRSWSIGDETESAKPALRHGRERRDERAGANEQAQATALWGPGESGRQAREKEKKERYVPQSVQESRKAARALHKEKREKKEGSNDHTTYQKNKHD